MNAKTAKKEASRLRILESARKLFNERGIDGASVADIMKDAGLTHGGFYAHFKNKSDLINHTFTHAMDTTRDNWFSGINPDSDDALLEALIDRYLAPSHRDQRSDGCPLPCLTSDMLLDKQSTGATIESALKKTLKRTSSNLSDTRFDDSEEEQSKAMATMAMLVGGVMLSRAAKTKKFSNFVLDSCKQQAREINGIAH